MLSHYGNLKKFMHVLTEYVANAYLCVNKEHKTKKFKKLYDDIGQRYS